MHSNRTEWSWQTNARKLLLLLNLSSLMKATIETRRKEEMSFIFGCHQWLSSSLTNISNSLGASFPVPFQHYIINSL